MFMQVLEIVKFFECMHNMFEDKVQFIISRETFWCYNIALISWALHLRNIEETIGVPWNVDYSVLRASYGNSKIQNVWCNCKVKVVYRACFS